MIKEFSIFEISPEAPESEEAMGTKEKFWFYHQELGLCLYKKARQNTGEDWSEKIAAELCKLIKLPHAEYELAIFNNEKGTISPSFLPENGSLTPGNEILAEIFLDYPEDIQDLSEHTLANIFRVFENSSVKLPKDWKPLEGIETAIDTFIGYLLLDAWIGNSDRHHENWAFIDFEGKRDIYEVLKQNPRSVCVRVERVNPAPTPIQFRLLCNMTAQWCDDFSPFSSQDYQPIVDVDSSLLLTSS